MINGTRVSCALQALNNLTCEEIIHVHNKLIDDIITEKRKQELAPAWQKLKQAFDDFEALGGTLTVTIDAQDCEQASDYGEKLDITINLGKELGTVFYDC